MVPGKSSGKTAFEESITIPHKAMMGCLERAVLRSVVLTTQERFRNSGAPPKEPPIETQDATKLSDAGGVGINPDGAIPR
jgi:hypothetical protein